MCNTEDPVAYLSHGAWSELDTDKGGLVGTGSDFINFGDAYGDGKTWRSLTKDEWDYMVNVRKVGGATGYGNTCVWWTFGYTQGLLIFPDGYTGSKTGFSGIPENAIFLPDAGYAKINSKEIPNGSRGCYWTSTGNVEATAYGVNMGQYNISFRLRPFFPIFVSPNP